jgi:hypothetical protein
MAVAACARVGAMTEAGWLLVALGGAGALWLWSSAARERVDALSREVCADLALQRLDEAVAWRGLRLTRDAYGLGLERLFSFEFSVTGADRCRAEVCLRGRAVLWVRLEHPDGPIVIDLRRAR